ncbi:MAG: FAD-dependent oxidoreductase [Phycisphaerae bacterium]|nr:FAD-dependent oxidoreductase [Phycisphaerae bacterium]
MAAPLDSCDVLVLGGGPAGICAAAQAARAGARTLLVERTGILGGTIVSAGVDFPGLFHAHGRQVIAGVGWDLVVRAVQAAGGQLPDFTIDHGGAHWLHHVRVDRAIFAALADETVLTAGASLLFHAMPAVMAPADPGWRVTLCLKEGLHPVHAGVVIDCTGDANAVALAGLPLRCAPAIQPGTIMLEADGYRTADLDLDAIERAAQAAIASGELLASDLGRRERPCYHFLAAGGSNRTHIPAVDASGSAGRTEMELAGRRCMMRLFRFFRRQPGLEKFRYRWFAVECGIRETVTIVGQSTITADDYASGRRWDDAVCYSYYPVDLHASDDLDIDIRSLAPGAVPTIPRGAMLPVGGPRLIVAGRTISGDRAANSAYRCQASCMAIGQAAGALASLAAADGCEPAAVPLPRLHDLLRRGGAIVPGDL